MFLRMFKFIHVVACWRKPAEHVRTAQRAGPVGFSLLPRLPHAHLPVVPTPSLRPERHFTHRSQATTWACLALAGASHRGPGAELTEATALPALRPAPPIQPERPPRPLLPDTPLPPTPPSPTAFTLPVPSTCHLPSGRSAASSLHSACPCLSPRSCPTLLSHQHSSHYYSLKGTFTSFAPASPKSS